MGSKEKKQNKIERERILKKNRKKRMTKDTAKKKKTRGENEREVLRFSHGKISQQNITGI